MIAHRIIALRVLASALVCAGLFFGCGDTGGRRITIRFRFAAHASEGRPLGEFDTDTGFHVVLSEARIAIGPVYALAPSSVARRASSNARALAAIFGPGIARAHGGVDPASGLAILGQSLEQLAFDALHPDALDMPPSIGTYGFAESLVLDLDPPTLENADAMHGHHAYVEGVASKDGTVIPFAGGIDLADDGTTRRVENVPLGATLDDGGVITIGIRPDRWLANAFFDRLGPADDDGVHPILQGGQVGGAFSIGLRGTSSYEAGYAQPMP